MVNRNKIIAIVLVIVFISAGYTLFSLSKEKNSTSGQVNPKVIYPPGYTIVFNKTIEVNENVTIGCIYVGSSLNFTNIIYDSNISGLLIFKSENKSVEAEKMQNCIALCLNGKSENIKGGSGGMIYSFPTDASLSPRGGWEICVIRPTSGFVHVVVCNYAGKSFFKYQPKVL